MLKLNSALLYYKVELGLMLDNEMKTKRYIVPLLSAPQKWTIHKLHISLYKLEKDNINLILDTFCLFQHPYCEAYTVKIYRHVIGMP